MVVSEVLGFEGGGEIFGFRPQAQNRLFSSRTGEEKHVAEHMPSTELSTSGG